MSAVITPFEIFRAKNEDSSAESRLPRRPNFRACSRKAACKMICSLLGVVGVIVLYFSLQRLPLGSYGLLVNRYSGRVINKSAFGPGGLYFVGVNGKFHQVPATLRKEHFNETLTRSSEGFSINCSITIIYRIQKQDVYDSYIKYSDVNIQMTVRRAVQASLFRVTSEYRAKEYWTKRSAMEKDLMDDLRPLFRERHLTLHDIVLGQIVIPDDLQESIFQTESKRQKYKIKLEEIERNRIIANTEAQILLKKAELEKLKILETQRKIAKVTQIQQRQHTIIAETLNSVAIINETAIKEQAEIQSETGVKREYRIWLAIETAKIMDQIVVNVTTQLDAKRAAAAKEIKENLAVYQAHATTILGNAHAAVLRALAQEEAKAIGVLHSDSLTSFGANDFLLLDWTASLAALASPCTVDFLSSNGLFPLARYSIGKHDALPAHITSAASHLRVEKGCVLQLMQKDGNLLEPLTAGLHNIEDLANPGAEKYILSEAASFQVLRASPFNMPLWTPEQLSIAWNSTL
eukprot:g2792.t1